MSRSFLVIFVISCFTAGAQTTGSLSGKISDAQAQALSHASVHLLNTNFGTLSDDQGSFSITAIPAGRYIFQVTAIGYANQSVSVTIESGKDVVADVTLNESATQLDHVIVTAQKQEEDLQKVPFTVSALSSRQVEQYRLWNSRDITAIVPNLYSANSGDNRNVTSIRGVTTTSYDPAVATYVDGVNQFGLDTYIAQLFDVERIEVLSGPQGTLYGRNAMGGVINIITKQPGNFTTGFGEVSIGNYGQQRYALGLRTPLVKNKLYLGATGVYDRNSGFYTNDFNGRDFDKKHSIIGNYYLKYYANPYWAITLNVKHTENRNNGAFPMAGNPGDALQNPWTVNQNALTKLIDNIFNTSLVVNHAGNRINFSSQTSYQSNHRYYKDPIDSDFSPADILTIINNYGKKWNNVKVVTQEFKFSSPASSSGPWKWTAGTYIFYQDNPVKQATYYGNDAPLLGVDDSNFTTTTTSTGKSSGIAFFGQVTYSVGDKFDVTGGLRYDYEHKKLNVLGEYQHDPDPNPNPVFETQPDTSATASFHAVSPKVTLAYHITSANTLFASYSRGFRAGGLTQLSQDPSQPPLYSFKPEYSNNIEVGSKNVFLDNRLQVNLSLFYVQINDAQVPTLVVPPGITVTRNTGKLTSKGIDLRVTTTPVKDLQIEYSLGLNDATFKTLKVASTDIEGNPTVLDLSGNQQIFTPNATSMTAVQYGYAIGKAKLIARGEWMLLGKQYFDLANNIEQDSYSIFNTRFGVTFSRFEVMFWGRNLGNEKYIAYAYDFGGTHLGNPRNFGVTARANF